MSEMIQPAIQTDKACVYHGNNIDILRQLPDYSVDSIVTDPPYELGFMGKKWDSSGIAYSVELWSECLRVLKSGGHLLAFSGSRTYHRMAVAIEDAGFEIRDQIMWVYGSGFPKSMDISKAIDKTAGAERNVIGENPNHRAVSGVGYEGVYAGSNTGAPYITAPATDEAQQWSGWGTALKPAHEPIVMARKPIDGTVANNVLKHGVGGINIDGCRIAPQSDEDLKQIRSERPSKTSNANGYALNHGGLEGFDRSSRSDVTGRFPANFIHDGSEEVTDLTGDAARFFYCAKASKAERNAGLEELPAEWKAAANFRPNHMEKALEGDSGNPFGRFQPTQNFHPTVKPLALMRYLVRLVTPPNGTVLDPFAGSGSTLVAATLEGFHSVGMELTEEYLPIIEGRLNWADNQQPQPQSLFDEP